jgi:hypothetical protein
MQHMLQPVPTACLITGVYCIQKMRNFHTSHKIFSCHKKPIFSQKITTIFPRFLKINTFFIKFPKNTHFSHFSQNPRYQNKPNFPATNPRSPSKLTPINTNYQKQNLKTSTLCSVAPAPFGKSIFLDEFDSCRKNSSSLPEHREYECKRLNKWNKKWRLIFPLLFHENSIKMLI